MEAPFVFGFILVLVWWNHRAKARKERYEIVMKALQSGQLDPETQRAMRQVLTGSDYGGWNRWALGVGWLSMCLGCGLLGADYFGVGGVEFLDLKGNEVGGTGITLAVVGFGVLALPIVLREFDRAGARERA